MRGRKLFLVGGEVVGAFVASKQLGFWVQTWGTAELFCVCMLYLCLRRFPLGAPAPCSSLKTRATGEPVILNVSVNGHSLSRVEVQRQTGNMSNSGGGGAYQRSLA